MHIRAVTVGVTDLGEAADFYGGTLQLPTELDRPSGALLVTVGRTLLRLQHRPAAVVCDHLAFGIPADAFPGAKRWLQERVVLYEQGGNDEFEGPPGWDSRSVYFPGPSGSVLELIARRRLDHSASGPVFTARDIRCVSEVGIAVPDVLGAVRELTAHTGLVPFGAAPSEVFAAVGDDHGLLILVVEGRVWVPTRDRAAVVSPLSVSVDELNDGAILIGGASIQ